MHRNLCLAVSLLTVACIPAKPKVATAPTSSAAETCSKDKSGVTYVIDGKAASCTSFMSLPGERIVSVEVLKGEAAVSLYGPSARAGVVLVQTKP
jgi:TonB-dependent SusC/RagA subfamily outer membrane receptor